MIDTRHTHEQLPVVAAERVRVLRNHLSSIEQRVAEVSGQTAYVIKAPTSGRVSTLQATVGQIADPKQIQLEIISAQFTLAGGVVLSDARVRVSVRPGLQVRIPTNAFPYQKFSTYRGSVKNVSRTNSDQQ